MPKISVVISTYNRPERLKKAIQSVIAQTYEDFELIIVADGMEDPAIAVVAEFANPKISYIGIEHFGNDTRPKNKGILESKGEYIAFLDDDNSWRPDHLQALVNELEKYDDLDMVYGDRWIVFEDGQLGQHGRFEDWRPGTLGDHNFIDTSDVLVKREALFAVGGFDERYKKYIDWNLWWRMEKYGFNFKRVPLILTDYYIHNDSMKSDRPEDSKGFMQPAWDIVECEVELPYLGEKREPRVAIFSLTYDRLEYTKACFESIYKTAGYPFTHFVVDNGSKDGTSEYLKQTYFDKEFTIIENPENKGISIASNQALDAINKNGVYDIIVKVDNDCLFLTPDWLKTMVKIWKSNHKIALSTYIQGLRDNPGGAPREFYGHICDEQVGFSKHLGGICHFVDAKAYKDFRWDEDSFLHGIQDLELSHYLLSKGYAMAYLENYFAEHYEGTEGQHSRFPEYFERRKLEKTTRYGENRKS